MSMTTTPLIGRFVESVMTPRTTWAPASVGASAEMVTGVSQWRPSIAAPGLVV